MINKIALICNIVIGVCGGMAIGRFCEANDLLGIVMVLIIIVACVVSVCSWEIREGKTEEKANDI